MRVKKKGLIIFISIFILVLLGLGAIGIKVYGQYEEMKEVVYRDVIYSGITINNIDVGEMSKNEALSVLQDYINEDNLKKELVLYYNDDNWVLTYEDWGFKANIEQLVEEAYQIGKEGTLRERYKMIKDLEQMQKSYDFNYQYDQAKIDQVLRSIDESFNKEIKDAIIIKEKDTFIIESEVIRYDLDFEASRDKIQNMLDSRKEGRVELVVNQTVPSITKDYLSHVEKVLGSYYTTFTMDNYNRNKNLELAANKMNGTLLMPGEVFSLMDAIGPVDSASGYYSAPIIYNGKLIPGVGGGVCQIATTLYNAVLNAELEIVERRNHSLPVAYVPLGQDATVSGNVVDFRFKNNLEYPIYIESFIRDNKLYAVLFGDEIHPKSRSIKYVPVVIETIEPPPDKIIYDETLKEDEEVIILSAKKGYRVKLYKEIYENDVLIDTVFVDYSYYSPRTGEKKLPQPIEEDDTTLVAEEDPVNQEDLINNEEDIANQENSNEQVDDNEAIDEIEEVIDNITEENPNQEDEDDQGQEVIEDEIEN